MHEMSNPAPSAMPRLRLRPPHLCAPLLLVALALSVAPALAGTYAGDVVVAPNPGLGTLDGLDLAPDGTGAMVYTQQDGGADHVFLSRLVNGAWSGPERIDAGLEAPSTQPAVAAGDGGRVVVAFVNAGNVYAVTRASASTGYVRQTLWSGGGAGSPAVDLSVGGKEYAVFTAPGVGGDDVRGAFARNAGSWSLIGAPLDANPAADAGAGAGRARVAASADGNGVVVWGESGHVYARRVQGTHPSVVFADANDGLSLEGVGASGADSPVVSVQDDDSFVAIAFRASFPIGAGGATTRVVYRRLRGSRFEGPYPADALPFNSGQGSDGPHVATVGTGHGLVVATGGTTYPVFALQLRTDSEPVAVSQLDAVPSTAPTYAAGAAATIRKMLVAWQYTPATGAPELHARYFADGAYAPEQLLSRPELGPLLAARGLLVAADDNGDLVVAYEQDVPGGGPAIAVAAVDQPPASFSSKPLAGFQRTDRPVLAWTTSREAWGRYFKVAIDGVDAGVTGQRSFRVRAPLTQGAHTWQVTVLDRRGQQFAARPRSLLIDSVPATVKARLSGARRAGAAVHLAVSADDAAPSSAAAGATPIRTSGVRAILVTWGDRTAAEQIQRGSQHVYAHPGRYLVKVVVTDGAGNRATVVQHVKIAKPKRKHGRK